MYAKLLTRGEVEYWLEEKALVAKNVSYCEVGGDVYIYKVVRPGLVYNPADARALKVKTGKPSHAKELKPGTLVAVVTNTDDADRNSLIIAHDDGDKASCLECDDEMPCLECQKTGAGLRLLGIYKRGKMASL